MNKSASIPAPERASHIETKSQKISPNDRPNFQEQHQLDQELLNQERAAASDVPLDHHAIVSTSNITNDLSNYNRRRSPIRQQIQPNRKDYNGRQGRVLNNEPQNQKEKSLTPTRGGQKISANRNQANASGFQPSFQTAAQKRNPSISGSHISANRSQNRSPAPNQKNTSYVNRVEQMIPVAVVEPQVYRVPNTYHTVHAAFKKPQNVQGHVHGANEPYLQKMELVISDNTVHKIMGPDPIPTLDIEFSEIQNELQAKMVEEIICAMCNQFPYSPLECRGCNKLFCKHCQLQLTQGRHVVHNEDDFADPELNKLSDEKLSTMSPSERKIYAAQMFDRQKALKARGLQGHYDVCCPNCQERGDFMQEVNKVLRNCIDFCEFPHRCFKNSKHGDIIWKTLKELQEHAMFDCPKFGCDICYHEDFQRLTRQQLFQHIKRECSEVTVQCQVCRMDFNRGEFATHECLKDKYLQRLKRHHGEVVEYLAEHLMRLRRSKEQLGLCLRPECVDRYKRSSQYKAGQGMVTMSTHNQAVKCLRCKTVVQGHEESYFCIYCTDCYCPPCLGYVKYFDMAELDNMIRP